MLREAQGSVKVRTPSDGLPAERQQQVLVRNEDLTH